jgi:hypothetical protein
MSYIMNLALNMTEVRVVCFDTETEAL